MSLNKKRPLATLYFAYRIIQRDFPLRAYVAPNVGDPSYRRPLATGRAPRASSALRQRGAWRKRDGSRVLPDRFLIRLFAHLAVSTAIALALLA